MMRNPLMPPSPPPASSPEDEIVTYDLATPEEIRTRKRRRKLVLALVLLLALAGAVALLGKPVLHTVKAWQARRIAAQADAFIDAEQWRDAQSGVQDAVQLWSQEPAAMRAAARFLTRVGHSGEAVLYWKQLEAARPLRTDEQRDFAAAELGLGNLDEADARLHRAWDPNMPGTPEDWRLALQLAARRHATPTVLTLARKLATSPAATERQRLDGALNMLAAGAPADQAEASLIVEKIADGRTPESLDALVLIARQAGAAAASATPEHPAPKTTLPGLATRLEAHPLARIQHRLLELDLELAADPSRRAELIDAAIKRFSNGSAEDLAGLGAWLYGKGEYAKALAVIPESKAVTSRALYLQRLDTLGALGRWNDIEESIQRQIFTLDPMVEQMYLARCSDQQGKTQARDVHWNSAIAAAGTSVDKLLSVGNYAARNGALGPAENAFRAAIKLDPTSRPAASALLELLQGEGRTAAMHETLDQMAARWPEDEAIRNDRAYTALLLGLDPAAARDEARELVRLSPGSLPHRVTLALAELRLGHALTALDAFRGLELSKMAGQPRHLAVYAAALWETSDEAAARKIRAQIPLDHLLPEERALVDEIKP